jgi:predicted DNA-binding protein
MEYSMTTSISLPLSLAHQLNRLAKKMRRGNDWIIVEALKEYLEKPNRYRSLAEEARRQSILASLYSNVDDTQWEENSDDRKWNNK